MKKIKVSTNLRCEGCVTKLGKVLDAQPKIHHWNADVSSPDRQVTIHGELTEKEVQELIHQAGFSVMGITSVEHPTHPTTHSQTGFWKDRKIWSRASVNTLNCLIGCMIGDFGMILYVQVYHPGTPLWLQMVLATIAGLITSVTMETALLHYREKLVWKTSLKVAVSMSFLSILVMELAMNATDFMITGGKAQLGSGMYWLAFLPSAVAGFLTPLPYYYYQLKKYNRSHH